MMNIPIQHTYFKFLNFILYVWVISLNVWICTMYVQGLQRPELIMGQPRIWITGGCEPFCVLGTKPGSFDNVVNDLKLWAISAASAGSVHCDRACLWLFSHFTLHCWVSLPRVLTPPCFQNWAVDSIKSLWLYYLWQNVGLWAAY